MRLKEERKKEKEKKSIPRGLRWKKEISCCVGVNGIFDIIKLDVTLFYTMAVGDLGTRLDTGN